eukprot:GFYU01003135.1.p1 GENE.GFYU01003135.1~~GFYU01003135.1.p1  ORF type:complete len:173 (+),score=10.21 GFYU01003135.1:320-838(+)
MLPLHRENPNDTDGRHVRAAEVWSGLRRTCGNLLPCGRFSVSKGLRVMCTFLVLLTVWGFLGASWYLKIPMPTIWGWRVYRFPRSWDEYKLHLLGAWCLMSNIVLSASMLLAIVYVLGRIPYVKEQCRDRRTGRVHTTILVSTIVVTYLTSMSFGFYQFYIRRDEFDWLKDD